MGYRPRIRRGGSTYDLPLPMSVMDLSFMKRTQSVVVPQEDGVFPISNFRGALNVMVSGIIQIGNPQDASRSIGMVTSLLSERDLLTTALIENNEPFIFYTYISGATVAGSEIGETGKGTRFFKDCAVADLNFNTTNRTVRYLPYSFSLLVPDGVEWRSV